MKLKNEPRSQDGGEPVDYKRRVIDDDLDELMPSITAISIDGPKGVGKTSTARQLVVSTMWLDDPATAQLMRTAPELIDSAAKPLLLDEWQRVPEVWDYVRRAVDARPVGAQFLLTSTGNSRAGRPVAPAHGR